MIRRDVVIDEGSHWNWAEKKIKHDDEGKQVTGGDEIVPTPFPYEFENEEEAGEGRADGVRMRSLSEIYESCNFAFK